jgi:hypothetical protein
MIEDKQLAARMIADYSSAKEEFFNIDDLADMPLSFLQNMFAEELELEWHIHNAYQPIQKLLDICAQEAIFIGRVRESAFWTKLLGFYGDQPTTDWDIREFFLLNQLDGNKFLSKQLKMTGGRKEIRNVFPYVNYGIQEVSGPKMNYPTEVGVNLANSSYPNYKQTTRKEAIHALWTHVFTLWDVPQLVDGKPVAYTADEIKEKFAFLDEIKTFVSGYDWKHNISHQTKLRLVASFPRRNYSGVRYS